MSSRHLLDLDNVRFWGGEEAGEGCGQSYALGEGAERVRRSELGSTLFGSGWRSDEIVLGVVRFIFGLVIFFAHDGWGWGHGTLGLGR